jgi:hypothetical protein
MAFLGNRLHIFDNLAFVPDMVTGSDDVRALIEKLVGDPRSYPEPPGCVFGVHHHQVHPPLLDQGAQVLAYNTPSSVAKYVTDKENEQKTPSI